jgi:ubiquinone/menaquinone biosynthesis C-methylase UbiE
MTQDAASAIAGDELVPPQTMLFDGSSSPAQFIALGDGFCRETLVNRIRLQESESILDVGCGNGQISRALTRILTGGGRYVGIDVHRDSISWLQEHYRAHPRFQFQHVDVHNVMYNPGGREMPETFQLSFPDRSFDVILLKSVFTHMLPPGVRAYLKEISRVLRPGGRAVISYFLLNDESQQFLSRHHERRKMAFEHIWNHDERCRIENPTLAEAAVAHDEERIRQYYAQVGLSTVEISYGDWCGRPSLLGLQDLIVGMPS